MSILSITWLGRQSKFWPESLERVGCDTPVAEVFIKVRMKKGGSHRSVSKTIEGQLETAPLSGPYSVANVAVFIGTELTNFHWSSRFDPVWTTPCPCFVLPARSAISEP